VHDDPLNIVTVYPVIAVGTEKFVIIFSMLLRVNRLNVLSINEAL